MGPVPLRDRAPAAGARLGTEAHAAGLAADLAAAELIAVAALVAGQVLGVGTLRGQLAGVHAADRGARRLVAVGAVGADGPQRLRPLRAVGVAVGRASRGSVTRPAA